MIMHPTKSMSSRRLKIALRYPNRFFSARRRCILLQQAREKARTRDILPRALRLR
jgi:hypothetical protein